MAESDSDLLFIPEVQLYRKKQKQRANRSNFSALIATPAVGTVTMPANARLAFVAPAGAAAGTTAATITGATVRTVVTPLLQAGDIFPLDYAERGAEVAVSAGFDMYIDMGLSNWVKIAEGA